MILYQYQGIVKYYVGWYGVCDETGQPDASDSDAPCQTLDLPTSKYLDDGSFVEWTNGKGAFREQLMSVVQVRDDGAGYVFYQMDNIRKLRDFYALIGYNTEAAIAQADLAAANPPNTNVDFDQMICGKAYTIVVQPGTGGAAAGSIVSQIDIPEFRYTYVGDADTGLRLTPECCGYSEG